MKENLNKQVKKEWKKSVNQLKIINGKLNEHISHVI